jgi:hypothetical protein
MLTWIAGDCNQSGFPGVAEFLPTDDECFSHDVHRAIWWWHDETRNHAMTAGRAAWLALAGCLGLLACTQPEPEPAITVPVMGIFTDRIEAFVGQSTSYPDGVGSIEAIGVRSGIQCLGSFAYRREVPGCRGSVGSAELQCSDGRYILASFVADACHSGIGIGVDQYGNHFRFTFGKTPEESRHLLVPDASAEPLPD